MGASAILIGVANHDQTAAIILRDVRRSASGVRRAIGPILRKTCRLVGQAIHYVGLHRARL
jgi:hypothetical protein